MAVEELMKVPTMKGKSTWNTLCNAPLHTSVAPFSAPFLEAHALKNSHIKETHPLHLQCSILRVDKQLIPLLTWRYLGSTVALHIEPC
jgi:hypothetical protein